MTMINTAQLTIQTNRSEWVIWFKDYHRKDIPIPYCGEFLLETLHRANLVNWCTRSSSNMLDNPYPIQQECMLRMMLRTGALHIHVENGKLVARICDNEPLPPADSLEDLFINVIFPHAAMNAYKACGYLDDPTTRHVTYIALYQPGDTYTAVPFSTLSPARNDSLVSRATCPVEALNGAVLKAQGRLSGMPDPLSEVSLYSMKNTGAIDAIRKLLKVTGLLCMRTHGSPLWRVVPTSRVRLTRSHCGDLFSAVACSAHSYATSNKEQSSEPAAAVPAAPVEDPIELVLHLDKFYSTAALCLPVSDMASIILSHEGTPVSVEAVASDRLQDAATASHKDSKLHVFCDVLFLDDPEGASFYIRVFVCHRGSCTLLKKIPIPHDIAETHCVTGCHACTDTTQRILLDYLRKNLTEIMETTKKSK